MNLYSTAVKFSPCRAVPDQCVNSQDADKLHPGYLLLENWQIRESAICTAYSHGHAEALHGCDTVIPVQDATQSEAKTPKSALSHPELGSDSDN